MDSYKKYRQAKKKKILNECASINHQLPVHIFIYFAPDFFNSYIRFQGPIVL